MYSNRPKLSTGELSTLLKTQPASIRSQLSKAGSYFGLSPTKLPNGRLLWPADSLERLTKGNSPKVGTKL